ncbi:hypothetical protein Sjap_008587 [Stephania japonica]|uniref:Gnk2-homologous domain-containing protein n=1 Tax=Stephania japonica TaxID=461633 RepID=A0AAP0PB08_9MAGN
MKSHHTEMVLFFPIIIIIVTISTSLIPSSKSASSDFTTLVYKGCANQTLSDQNGGFSQTLNSLFNTLVTHSSKSKFFKTTNSQITGLFQCRGDLSASDCYSCVSQIPQISSQLCGAAAAAARIQLRGCYALYEASGFPTVSGLQLLYKVCGRNQISGSGFEERRDTALAAVESGIGSGNGNGFFATSYQNVYALGQCEGDLGAGDCGGCVKTAAQRAQVECGSAVSGQVYLYKCFINYAYYPNGVSDSAKPSGSGQNTGKTIAIVVGGVAAAGFAVILLLFLRSLLKKHDGKSNKNADAKAQDPLGHDRGR